MYFERAEGFVAVSAVLVVDAGVGGDMNGYGKAEKTVAEELVIDRIGGLMGQGSLGK